MKAGTVFLHSLKTGAQITKKADSQIFLIDDEASKRLQKELRDQKKGDLETRLKQIAFAGSDRITVQQFTKFVLDVIGLDKTDLMSLLKITRFATVTAKDQSMAITAVVKNIRDRAVEAKKIRIQVIKKIAMLMTD